jgi:hypothetical protein
VRDVLEVDGAKFLERQPEAIADLVAHHARDADGAAGRADRLRAATLMPSPCMLVLAGMTSLTFTPTRKRIRRSRAWSPS